MTVRSQLRAGIVTYSRVGQRNVQGWLHRLYTAQDYVLIHFFRPHGVTVLYWCFGFVFFYFGFQKPSPAQSPVRVPLAELFAMFGIPVEAGMLFIGGYEMFLGMLFFFKQLRVAFWFFFAHMFVSFLTLFLVPLVAFQPPYLAILGMDIPWATTGFGEFVIKNIVFVAGFMLLMAAEHGRELSEEPDE